jgi:hypothetical protein
VSGSVPTNVVSSNGVGVISDAQANSYVQVGGVLANVRAFNNALSNMIVYLEGFTSPGDGGQGDFYWDSSSTTADDGGVTAIQPNGVTIGRWLRLVESTTAPEWNAGLVNAIGANLSIVNDTLVASGTLGVGTITAGSGLSGGGSATNVTISATPIGPGQLSGNPSGGSAVAQGVTLGPGLSFSGTTLESSASEWSAGVVTGLAGGLTIAGTTLTAPTAAFAVGTCLLAQYQVAATPTTGASYAGSTLGNAATAVPFGASGTWTCMGPLTAYSSPTFAIALFLRTS